MKLVTLIAVLEVLSFATTVAADDVVVEEGARLTSDLVILVDGSGSMGAGRGATYRAAIDATLWLLVEATDATATAARERELPLFFVRVGVNEHHEPALRACVRATGGSYLRRGAREEDER